MRRLPFIPVQFTLLRVSISTCTVAMSSHGYGCPLDVADLRVRQFIYPFIHPSIHTSTHPSEREQADISEALLRSKVDAHSADRVVLAWLTYHSPFVFDHLLASEDLEACVARVENAGCEVRPPWANDALLLVPLRESQAAEWSLQLKAHNVPPLALLPLEDEDVCVNGLKHFSKKQSKRGRKKKDPQPGDDPVSRDS